MTDGRRAWTGLLLPPLAWMLFQYGLGATLRGPCAAVGAWLGPLWGAVSLLLCLAAVLIARPLARAVADPGPPPRAWLARLAMLGAGIFALAIAFQTLATLIVPPCVR